MQCAICKKDVEIGDKVYFRDECPHCAADLHVCKNCDFYDPYAAKECREPNAELVTDKERANYCDYFRPSSGHAATDTKAEEAKKTLEELFRKN